MNLDLEEEVTSGYVADVAPRPGSQMHADLDKINLIA